MHFERLGNIARAVFGKIETAPEPISAVTTDIPVRKVEPLTPNEAKFLSGTLRAGSEVCLEGIHFNSEPGSPSRVAAEEFFQSLKKSES